MEKLTDFITEIDNNTFILGSPVISVLQKTNSGNLFIELDEILKLGKQHNIYIITKSSVLNYLTKFHKLDFETMFIGGVSLHILNYTSTKQINFIIQ